MHKLLTLLIILACLFLPALAEAQTDISTQINTITLDFPNQLSFSLQAVSNSEIDQIYLFYRTAARSCTPGNVRARLDFESMQQVTVDWDWDFKDSGSLPPGTQVTWFWEIHNAAGSVLTTLPQTFTIEDPNYEWIMLQEGDVSIYWVEGDQAFGNTLMQIAQDALTRLATSAGLRPEGKIRLNVYPSADALQKAALFLPEWTGGVAIFEHGVIMAGIGEGETQWAKEVIPHELAHLVIGEQIFNCLGIGLPTWLSEGLAVSSEGPISDYDRKAVENSLMRGSLPLLRTLTAGFPVDPQKTNLAYAMSGEVVRYMLAEYGPEKMSALLSAIQSGMRIDPALQAVYGMSTDELDRAWRASMGYDDEIVLESPTPTLDVARTAVPTIALWSPFQAQASPTTELLPSATIIIADALTSPTPVPFNPTPIPESTSGSSRLPCAGSLGTVGLLAGAGFVLHRRRGSYQFT